MIYYVNKLGTPEICEELILGTVKRNIVSKYWKVMARDLKTGQNRSSGPHFNCSILSNTIQHCFKSSPFQKEMDGRVPSNVCTLVIHKFAMSCLYMSGTYVSVGYVMSYRHCKN